MNTLRQYATPEATLTPSSDFFDQDTMLSRELNIRSMVLDQVALTLYCDAHGTIIHVNDFCCSALKVTRVELIGKPLHRILSGHLSDNTISALLHEADTRGNWKGFLSIRGSGDETMAGYAIVCPIRDENHVATRYIIALDTPHLPELNAFTVTEKQIDLVYNIHRARKVQQAFFQSEETLQEIYPKTALLSKSAHQVGGDLHWMSRTQDQLNIVFGDATGKGVSASYVSLAVISWLFSNASMGIHSTKRTASQINNFLFGLLKKDALEHVSESVDMAVATIDLKSKMLRLTSAKTRVAILRKGEILMTLQDRVSLGEMHTDAVSYTAQTIELETGDRVIFFTDGMIDQLDSNAKRLGKSGFKQILLKAAQLDIENQRKFIQEQMDKFKGDSRQTDDMTLLMIEI